MNESSRPTFLGKTAIAGVGYTPITRSSGVSVLALAVSACRNAIADAGLSASDVDGIVTFSLLESFGLRAGGGGRAGRPAAWLCR